MMCMKKVRIILQVIAITLSPFTPFGVSGLVKPGAMKSPLFYRERQQSRTTTKTQEGVASKNMERDAANLISTDADQSMMIDAVSHDTYDYILVGGGASACVLAYRLDQMGYKVLMLERGPHHDEVSDSRHINGWPSCWNSNGVKEMEYDDGRIAIVGNTIGGGTTINVGVTWEETPSFFTDMLGSDWWSKSDMKEAIIKMRRMVDPITLPVDDVCKEFTVGLEAAVPEIKKVRNGEIKPRSHNSNMITNTWVALKEYPQCPSEYYRQGSADVFWKKSNARTMHSVRVERVLFENENTDEPNIRGGQPRAIGVEYVESTIRGILQDKPQKKKVYLSKGGEVVLCAGAIASPCLLMHSGIGPEKHLHDIGIEVRVPLEEVGRNFIDRPLAPLLKTFSMCSKHRSLWVPCIATKADTGFMEFTSGNTFECMLTSMTFLPRYLRGQAWLRSLIRFLLKAFRKVIQKNIDQSLIVGCSITEVHTRGRVMLQSNDPNAHPRIKNKFLSDSRDLESMNEVVKAAIDGINYAAQRKNSILSSKGPLDFVINRLIPNACSPMMGEKMFKKSSTRNLCSTFYHNFGTCSIGKVVDDTLAVHGVEGLRVCDAAIFSRATRLNPQQAIMTMAWRAADIIVQTKKGFRDSLSASYN